MNGNSYPGDRVARRHQLGFMVIIPADNDVAPVPLACPLCECLMRTQEDDSAFVDWGCCDKCAMAFAHPARAEWKKGWRPSREAVAENLLARQRLTIVIS